MKVGDLVRVQESSVVYRIRSYGIVIEVVPASKNWKRHVYVSWIDGTGDVEMEVPEFLNIISAT